MRPHWPACGPCEADTLQATLQLNQPQKTARQSIPTMGCPAGLFCVLRKRGEVFANKHSPSRDQRGDRHRQGNGPAGLAVLPGIPSQADRQLPYHQGDGQPPHQGPPFPFFSGSRTRASRRRWSTCCPIRAGPGTRLNSRRSRYPQERKGHFSFPLPVRSNAGCSPTCASEASPPK